MLSSFELLDVAEALNFIHANGFLTRIFTGVSVIFRPFRVLQILLARRYRRSQRPCSCGGCGASLDDSRSKDKHLCSLECAGGS